MPETWTVTKARYAGEKDNPHGGKLHKFYCSFTDANGNGQSDVYWQRKSEQSPEGEQFYGHIDEGEFGPRFYTDQNPNGSQGRSGGSSGAKDDYWQKKEQRDVESQARQGRAHAQGMALQYCQIVGKDPGAVESLAQVLGPVIDWFHRDVQRFPEEDQRPETNPAVRRQGEAGIPAASTSSDRIGFASDKQKLFFERLLKDAGLTSQQVVEINRYVTEALATDRVSKAIDAIKEGDRDKAIEALLQQSLEWHKKQTDMPFDDEGLPPLRENAA